MKKLLIAVLLLSTIVSCSGRVDSIRDINVSRFANTLSISSTPKDDVRNVGGYFLDMGSWAGYTIPETSSPVGGFCGPFDINSQRWISRMLVGIESAKESSVVLDTTIYYPGAAYIKGSVADIEFSQNLYFANKNSAVLRIDISSPEGWILVGDKYAKDATSEVADNQYIIRMDKGEVVSVAFPSTLTVELNSDGSYKASTKSNNKTIYAVLSYWNDYEEFSSVENIERVNAILSNPEEIIKANNARWGEYIAKTVREDMPEEYNRIAVKAVMTLISNWKAPKGDLYHEGIIPSHAVRYFNGFWAWDSWKHAAAVVYIEPELAKNQIRTMFDYQWEDGMVVDCIYADKSENNERDTKSSIVAWAVKEIYDQTQDTAFIKEMMPKMVKYYNWWYQKRDINKNNLCEFGSTDGTLLAAKWESGMDNAVRFDKTTMKKISDDAWVMDQESIDLNTFLVFEREKLLELAAITGDKLDLPDHREYVKEYFFNKDKGFFYDRLLDGRWIEGEACEGWLPLWTKLASKEQAQSVKEMIVNPNKFSTYIPFPTCAADVQGFNPEGYWRGAVWLDQAYFGIKGLRNYGYSAEADEYTKQLFERCEGLLGDGPITENYNPIKGTRAQARHFSWSAAHILMMYKEYGK